MFDHLYLGKDLHNQVNALCHVMDTHHECIVFVDELHSRTQLGTLKCGHHVCSKWDQIFLIFGSNKPP